MSESEYQLCRQQVIKQKVLLDLKNWIKDFKMLYLSNRDFKFAGVIFSSD